MTNPAPRTGVQPRYLQLYAVLRARLEAGRWRKGQTLPPIPELMAEFDASRITIRQALEMLESEGAIRKRRGIGTTVERDLTLGRWVNLPTSLDELMATIDTIRPEVLNLEHGAMLPEVPIPADESAAASYVRMRRVHLRDGEPYCLIDLALDEKLYRKRPARFRRHPVLSVMKEIPGLRIASARQQLTIRSADVDEAHHLSIEPGAPVADVRRSITDARGVVIYAAVVLYPSRSVRLDMNLLVTQRS
jgi:GntR family transcriptional regulator